MGRIFTNLYSLAIVAAMCCSQLSYANETSVNDVAAVSEWLSSISEDTQELLPEPKTPQVHALVLTNDKYTDLSSLPGVKNDRKLMSDTFKALGFKTYSISNFKSTESFFKEFRRKVVPNIDEGDIVVIHYSGHGMSLNGYNYLIPTKTSSKLTKSKFTIRTVPMNKVLDDIYRSYPGLVVFLFDACRTVPDFEDESLKTKGDFNSHGRSYQWTTTQPNTLVGYANPLGYSVSTGSDSKTPSLYSEELSLSFNIINNITSILKDVKANVESNSGGEQSPGFLDWSAADPSLSNPPEDTNLKREFWLNSYLIPAIRFSKAGKDFRAEQKITTYLKRYSTSEFAVQARYIKNNELISFGNSPPKRPVRVITSASSTPEPIKNSKGEVWSGGSTSPHLNMRCDKTNSKLIRIPRSHNLDFENEQTQVEQILKELTGFDKSRAVVKIHLPKVSRDVDLNLEALSYRSHKLKSRILTTQFDVILQDRIGGNSPHSLAETDDLNLEICSMENNVTTEDIWKKFNFTKDSPKVYNFHEMDGITTIEPFPPWY